MLSQIESLMSRCDSRNKWKRPFWFFDSESIFWYVFLSFSRSKSYFSNFDKASVSFIPAYPVVTKY